MAATLFIIGAATAFSPQSAAFAPAASRAAVSSTHRAAATVRMFEEEPKKDPNAMVFNQVTRSREVGADREGSIVVTDGSGSFYNSRLVFQQLHDFGKYASIVAASSDVPNAKKMLISRAGRYSGLTDVLSFHEGAEASAAMSPGGTWLAIQPDEATLGAEIDAVVKAGAARIFLLLGAALDDEFKLESKLKESGVEYTVMRTGPLVDGPGGTGLKLAELGLPVCEDVPRDDVFRFVTEALTLPEAAGRAFSLCPAPGVESTLKQMRLCGYERREEVQLLLQGVVREQDEAANQTPEEAAEAQELVLRSEAELAAEREEELKMLLARAKEKGIENQKKLAAKEEEDKKRREEMAAYYSAPKDGDSGDAPAEEPPADEPKA